MLGDNRDDSEDPRYWGFVPRTGVKGKPLFIYYSFEPRSRRRAPWLSSIRWDRIGNTVHLAMKRLPRDSRTFARTGMTYRSPASAGASRAAEQQPIESQRRSVV